MGDEFKAGVAWAKENGSKLPPEAQQKLMRAVRQAMGGSADAQKEFLQILNSAAPQWKSKQAAPQANADPLAPVGCLPPRPGHEINKAALENYLRSKLWEFKGPLVALLQFQGGQSNPTYYLRDSAGKEYVLRKKPAGKLLPSAHAVDREYRIMKALHGKFPVPQMYCLCEDDSVIGQMFYVMEFVRGRIFKDPNLPELKPSERSAVYDAMNEALVQLHSLDYKALGLSDYGRAGPPSYYVRQLDRWWKQYTAARTGDMPEMDRLYQLLSSNMPSDTTDVSCLVHGDLRIDNVVFHPTQPNIVAVLDWELSTLGHPISDIAYFCQPFHPVPSTTGMPLDNSLGYLYTGIPTEEMFRAQYERRMKLSSPISNWKFYVAFSMFRSASILQGVYKRFLQGNASDARAELVGASAKQFAAAGCGLLDGTAKRTAAKSHHPNQVATTEHSAAGGLFEPNARTQDYMYRINAFMERIVLPGEHVFEQQHRSLPDRWLIPPVLEEMKQRAKAEGLWNLFLPHDPVNGAGLSNLEYAPLAEIMGRSVIAPECFNCNAPDTGNMEILNLFATPEQRKKWLDPLLAGDIRSCFAMTEPRVASSDATNIETSIRREGNEYVINGRKWWISNAGDPRCKLAIVMGKTDTTAPVHKQQSMVIVPFDNSALLGGEIRKIRALTAMGYDDAPWGHLELEFVNVRVPCSNILLGEGRGFEIAQARLGPGRIHHCMRQIGLAERCLEAMCWRVKYRRAFGRFLREFATIQKDIADSRIEIDQCRLLTLQAAHAMDTVGPKHAKALIAEIKVAAPLMCQRVADRAIQAFGAGGMSDDFPLARALVWSRCLRLADGPDEVHRRTIAQEELKKIAKL